MRPHQVLYHSCYSLLCYILFFLTSITDEKENLFHRHKLRPIKGPDALLLFDARKSVESQQRMRFHGTSIYFIRGKLEKAHNFLVSCHLPAIPKLSRGRHWLSMNLNQLRGQMPNPRQMQTRPIINSSSSPSTTNKGFEHLKSPRHQSVLVSVDTETRRKSFASFCEFATQPDGIHATYR